MLKKNFLKKESNIITLWKKQLCIFFLKHYQISRESRIALMNPDEDYFNILNLELSKPVGKFKRKIINENENINLMKKKNFGEVAVFYN